MWIVVAIATSCSSGGKKKQTLLVTEYYTHSFCSIWNIWNPLSHFIVIYWAHAWGTYVFVENAMEAQESFLTALTLVRTGLVVNVTAFNRLMQAVIMTHNYIKLSQSQFRGAIPHPTNLIFTPSSRPPTWLNWKKTTLVRVVSTGELIMPIKDKHSANPCWLRRHSLDGCLKISWLWESNMHPPIKPWGVLEYLQGFWNLKMGYHSTPLFVAPGKCCFRSRDQVEIPPVFPNHLSSGCRTL